jgi:hypothetical protein
MISVKHTMTEDIAMTCDSTPSEPMFTLVLPVSTVYTMQELQGTYVATIKKRNGRMSIAFVRLENLDCKREVAQGQKYSPDMDWEPTNVRGSTSNDLDVLTTIGKKLEAVQDS